jgi:anti-sigma B factor antagonist
MGQLSYQQQAVKLVDGSDCLLAKIGGSIDAASVAELESIIQKMLQDNFAQIVLNLSGLTYISSPGLGVLMRYVHKCRERGGDIKVTQLPPNIWAIFRTVGLHSIFEVMNSDQQAIDRFQEQTNYKPVAKHRYPARFKCPGCAGSLEVAKPGKYTCPHCHSCFAAETTGAVRAFISRRPKLIEATLLGNRDGLDWFKGLVRSQTQWMNFTRATRDKLENALDKVYHLLTGQINKSEESSYRLIVVTGTNALIIGLIDIKRTPFEKNGLEESPEWKSIQNLVDTLEFIPLTPHGYIIKMVKLLE